MSSTNNNNSPGNPPPASQIFTLRPPPPADLKSPADLSAEQKRSCDDLISELNKALGVPDIPTANDRTGLWALVFDGWNSDCLTTHPGVIRGRRNVEVMIPVGVWNTNLPVATRATATKRRNSGQVTLADGSTMVLQTKRERMAGAAAYMKPNPNFDDFGISLPVCDANGCTANPRFVTWRDGWTPQKARAEALLHWDRAEVDRVTEHNFKVITYWARARLIGLSRAPNGASDAGDDGFYLTENMDEELVKLVLCQDKLKDMQALIDDVKAISAARGVRRKTMADTA